MSQPRRPCPACERSARGVPLTTLQQLTDRSPSWELAWFCATPNCEVVYFSDGGETIAASEVRVDVFQKGTDRARPVCYCFGHSVADVLEAQRDDGTNSVAEAIARACRQGLDRCEQTNPQGRCCMGNVRELLRGATAPGCCDDQS